MPTRWVSKTWEFFEQSVKKRKIEVLYETPGMEFVQDRITREILGVKAFPKGGDPIHVKARKAVGADLWHMNNYAGPSMALKVPEYRTTFSLTPLHFSHEQAGGMICVGPDGGRFCDEKLRTMHGKIKKSGKWVPTPVPCPMHMIFDHGVFSSGPLYDKKPVSGWDRIVERYDWSDDNVAELKRGWIKRAASVGELAKLIGLDRKNLEASVKRWNDNCASGADPDFGRKRMLAPLSQGPYYAIELVPSMLNTQGGPRRNAKAQIVRPDDTPIPRLYSAGELGSIYSYMFEGTGNIGECFALGRIAARNALAEKPWG